MTKRDIDQEVSTKPLVVDYLRNHTFQHLEDEHGVLARPSTNGDKFSLNYDQIMTKSGDKLAEQCRGLVIRPVELDWFDMMTSFTTKTWKDIVVGDTEVLAWPMNRFYNHGDTAGANVDWDDAQLRVYEKLDGTMIVCYWDPVHQRWFAGTRAVAEADLPIRLGDMQLNDTTFSQLFLQAAIKTREALSGPVNWEVDSIDKVIHLNKELTYVFELTSPHNRVVVRYDEPRVTLLAVRHTATGQELPIETLRLQHVKRPNVWNLKSASALEAFVNSANPAELEGCVVCDSKFNRLKVKNKAWILSSRAKDLVMGPTRRGALEAIITGTIDDVIPIVEKSIADELTQLQTAFATYLTSVDANFVAWRIEADGNRKRFAELVNLSNDWATPYFQMMDGKGSSTREWLVATQAAGRLSPNILDTLLKRVNGFMPSREG